LNEIKKHGVTFLRRPEDPGSAKEKIDAIWEKIIADDDVAAPFLWLHFFVSDGNGLHLGCFFCNFFG